VTGEQIILSRCRIRLVGVGKRRRSYVLVIRAFRELLPGRHLRSPTSGKCSVDEIIVAAALRP